MRVRTQDDAARRADRAARRRQLQFKFLGTAGDYAVELIALLGATADRRPDGDAGQRFRKLAHDLRGSGAAYGFLGLSESAAKLETAYMDAENGNVLRAGVQELDSAVRAARVELETDQR